MAGEFKPVPTGAADLTSFQLYSETCRQELKSRAPSATWDPSKAQVFNRSDGDGRFEVLYQDPAADFICAGQWHWPSQELLIRAGKVSEKSTQPLAGTRIPDACQATEGLAGANEFAGAVCRQGEDPLLPKVASQESVRKFAEYCSGRLQAWGSTRFGVSLASTFDLKHSRIDNSVAGDGFYSLIYESRSNQFVCEGMVDANARQMFLHSGSPKQIEDGSADDGLVFSMLDACAITTELFGENEIGACKDQSERDRSVQEYVGFGVQAFLGVTSSYAMYRFSRKLWASKMMGFFRNLPIVRNLGSGLLAGAAFDTAAGIFVDDDHALRRYGTPAVTVLGMAAPEFVARTAIGQRLASTALLGRAAPWASRLGWGLAAVGVVNWIGKKIMNNSSYQESVNHRVTEQVYTDDGLYELEWWDLFPPHLALKGLRRGCRAIAPDIMEGAVTWDNESVEDKIKAEDLEQVKDANDFLRETLPAFLHAENEQDRNEILALLSEKEIEFSDEEEKWAKSLAKDGYVGLRADFPALTDEAAETFCRKYLMKQVQQAASWIVFVPGAESDWAREYFNKNGTLKKEAEGGGVSPAQMLQHRWPKPPEEKNEVTSEAYEILGSGDLMG